jgi:amino acid adenylation domain-containing protein
METLQPNPVVADPAAAADAGAAAGYTLSPQQRAAWLRVLRHGGGPACHAVAGELPAGTGLAQLQMRLAAVLADQEILRTRYRHQAGLHEPVQVPEPFDAAQLRLHGEDWRAAAPAEAAQRRQALWRRACALRVDIGVAAFAAQLPGGGWFLVLAVAPLSADTRTLLRLLRAAGGGGAPAGALQYADLAAWLQEVAEAPDSEAGRRFWHAQAAAGADGGLVFDRGRPLPGHSQPQRQEWPLPDALCSALAAPRARSGLRLDDLHFAAWLWLLRALGADEALVPAARVLDGASAPELAQSLGPLERQLPFALPAGLDLEAPGLPAAVARLSSGLREYQDCCPVDALRGAVPHAFQCLEVEGLAGRVEQWQCLGDRFRTRGTVLLQPGHGRLVLDHHPELLSDADARHFLEQWAGVLADLAAGGGTGGSPLGVRMTPARQEQLLALCRGPALPPGPAGNVVAWMQAGLAAGGRGCIVDGTRHPLAVVNRRANRLAHEWRRQGIGRGQVVGLHLPRSCDYVVAMLAVLKTGAAYLPMDVDYPHERLAYMAADARPVLVVGGGGEAPAGAWPGEVRRVSLAQAEQAAAAQAGTDPGTALQRDDLAYVLYTSGSTGKPKGVAIPHGALCNHMQWMLGHFGWGADQVFLQRTSSSFDASVWEFWAPLLAGATLVIARQDKTYDLAHLIGLIDRERVSVAQFVPSLLDTLVDYPAFTGIASLRQVFAGGEALTRSLKARFFGRMPQARLCNLYGPTEACIDATFQECTPADPAHIGIGRPIANTSVVVVDGAGRLAGTGIAGEICIAGAGLFQGYLHRPDLTAGKTFVPAFSPQRHYRTGDRGRVLSDGSIEYLGRRDQQVKLHGHRIELSEIDAVMAAQPGVARAVTVVGRPAQLVTFVQPAGAPAPGPLQPEALLAGAQRLLPHYMVPARVMPIDAFPLLPSGKTDHAALRALADAAPEAVEFNAPQTAAEATLAAIWCKVLRLDRVSVTDRFFSVGGDSIRSIQVVYEAAQQGLVFTVMDIFRHQTVRALAGQLRPEPAQPPGAAVPAAAGLPANPAPAGLLARFADAYPATGMQRHMIARYAQDQAAAGVFHAQQAWRIQRPGLDAAALADALARACNAPNFRTRFVIADDGQCFQAVLPDSGVAVEVADLTALAPAEQALALQQRREADRLDRFDPFDTTRALVRIAVCLLAPDCAEVLVSNHHAIQDGWGNVEFLNRVARHYRQPGAAGGSAPPAGDATCREFALRQHALAADPAQAAFWRLRAAGFPPTGAPLAGAPGRAYRTEVAAIDPALAQAVHDAGRRRNLTAKSIYLAAFLDALRALGWSGVAGVVSNGRNEQLSDPLRAMGLFWNLMPLAIELPPRPQGLDRCAWLQDELLALEPYSRYPLPDIEALSRPGLVSASFNFVNFHHQDLGEGGHGGWLAGTHALDNFGVPVSLTIGMEGAGATLVLLQDAGLPHTAAELRDAILASLRALLGPQDGATS